MFDPKVSHGRLGAKGDEQMALAGAGVTDEAEGLAFANPVAGSQGVDDCGVNIRVGRVIEGAKRLFTGECGGPDAAFGAPAGAVIAFGEQQFSQERAVGLLLAGGGVDGFGEVPSDRG